MSVSYLQFFPISLCAVCLNTRCGLMVQEVVFQDMGCTLHGAAPAADTHLKESKVHPTHLAVPIPPFPGSSAKRVSTE